MTAGRPTDYSPKYPAIAQRMCYLGATDRDLAIAFDVHLDSIFEWRARHPEFSDALKIGKKLNDERVERSLYQKAVGYNYMATKVFLPYGSKEPVLVQYMEHVPPSDVACIFWLKNRNPAQWRDAWQLEHVTGKYVISDKPLTEDAWIRERGAEVIEGEAKDVTPVIGDTTGTR
jgi:hypothetical protein